MRRTVSAAAVGLFALAAVLGVSAGPAAAGPGGSVVQLHPPKCC